MESKVKIPVESKSGRLTARSSTVFPEFAFYDGNRTKNTDLLISLLMCHSSINSKDRDLEIGSNERLINFLCNKVYFIMI